MKIKELKKMIKDAFIAEAEFTNDETFYDSTMEEADSPVKEKSLDDMLADIMGTEKDPYMAEDLSEAEEEEVDIEIDAEEEVEDEGSKEEKPANDSIVVDKRIVSLSSLPNDTRKILDSLETLRAQAEEFGDQKFITQVGNTITFFTRDFVVAGDEPTKEKVDESLEILRMKKLAGLITEEKAQLYSNKKAVQALTDAYENIKIMQSTFGQNYDFQEFTDELQYIITILEGMNNILMGYPLDMGYGSGAKLGQELS